MAEIQVPPNDQDPKLVISRVKQVKGIGDNPEVYFAPFGVDDENVKIFHKEIDQETGESVWVEWGNLRNFFEEWENFKETWQDFLENSKHMQYKNSSPDNSQVKVWYDTTSNS